jgi:hypothetical protein
MLLSSMTSVLLVLLTSKLSAGDAPPITARHFLGSPLNQHNGPNDTTRRWVCLSGNGDDDDDGGGGGTCTVTQPCNSFIQSLSSPHALVAEAASDIHQCMVASFFESFPFTVSAWQRTLHKTIIHFMALGKDSGWVYGCIVRMKVSKIDLFGGLQCSDDRKGRYDLI